MDKRSLNTQDQKSRLHKMRNIFKARYGLREETATPGGDPLNIVERKAKGIDHNGQTNNNKSTSTKAIENTKSYSIIVVMVENALDMRTCQRNE